MLPLHRAVPLVHHIAVAVCQDLNCDNIVQKAQGLSSILTF